GAAALLSACAGGPEIASAPASLFHDDRFRVPQERISTDDIFTLSEPMRHYLAVDIAERLRTKGAQAGLVEALYQKGQLKIEYDTATTKTAAATFATRSGNCLSLVLMTTAFARELNLPFYYGSALIDDTWSRSGDFLVASGHVNVTIGRRTADARSAFDLAPLTIDFLPAEDVRYMRHRDIGEATVIAMYANNHAAEALAAGRLDSAYAWSREALRHDPAFPAAWNMLGVVYLRHGDVEAAAPVFEHALALSQRDSRALANLAQTYSRLGRTAEAEAMRLRLRALEPFPPFHFFNLGLAAMARADYTAARTLFARELARDDDRDEFHFWLGLAYFRLGDIDAARDQLARAAQSSVTRGQHDLYAAKLAWLQGQARKSPSRPPDPR
ncbi:MAG: tetratricopeptide repeat protein, partial [Caldimonas sp.]